MNTSDDQQPWSILLIAPAPDEAMLHQRGQLLTPPLRFVQGTPAALLQTAGHDASFAAVVVAYTQPDGADLLRTAVAVYDGPVVAIGDPTDEQAALDAGATAFVSEGPGYWHYLPALVQGVVFSRHVAALETFKDQFVAVASHELKNPLAAIRGYAELLLRRIQRSPSDERTAKGLSTILQQSLRMQSLLDDLHDLSRFSRRLNGLHVRAVEVEPVIQRVVEIQQRLGNETPVEVQLESSPCRVLGDAERLQQVFGRLLALVVDASPEGVSVQISIGPVRVTPEGQVLSILIRGQGGLLAADMEQAFDNFYSAATASRITATERLGLYLAAQFVALHGGLLSFEQEADGESGFRVELPCAD